MVQKRHHTSLCMYFRFKEEKMQQFHKIILDSRFYPNVDILFNVQILKKKIKEKILKSIRGI